MKSSHKTKTLLSRFMKNDSGNFGLMTAILLPVTLASAGIAIDLTRMVQIRTELQNSADSAAMAAASAMSDKGMSKEEALKLARNYLAAQMSNQVATGSPEEAAEAGEQAFLDEMKNEAIIIAQETANGPTGKIYDITVTASYNVALNGMTRLLGISSVPVSVSGTAQSATESKNALSMYLVLDRSGSMAEDTNDSYSATCSYVRGGRTYTYACTKYYTKIEALKTAVQNLAGVLETADPQHIYARTAAVSYHSSMQTPTAFQWGTSNVVTYVNALPADGGTNSADAMAKAYSEINSATETTAHKNKNGQVPSRYIVFMTDGDNNDRSSDTKTKKTCEDAKKAGIEIYTVALMAPERGKALLKECATSDDHYSEAESAAALVAEFKAIGEKASAAITRLTN